MKDIQYFVSEEDKYLASPQAQQKMVWDDEFECFDVLDDPLYFLHQKPFTEFQKAHIINNNIYGITKIEELILACFMGNISYAFRNDYYHKNSVPEIAQEMQVVLESVIRKAPKYSGEILYRFTTHHDRTRFEIGEIFTPDYSLTTTNEYWGQERSDVYVITPLPEDQTNAHSLYMIYNHGDENQVNFLHGTYFKIDKIDPIPDTEYNRIYMSEI